MTTWHLSGLENLQSKNPFFESTDPTITKSETTKILKDHQLKWKKGKINSALIHAEINDLSFIILRYGASVHVAPDFLNNFYLFQVPIFGKSSIQIANKTIFADCHKAIIISPDVPVRMDWHEECIQFLIKIPKPLLDHACMQLLDIAPEEQIEFQPEYELNNSNSMAWQHQVSAMLSYATEHQYPEKLLKNLQSNLLQHLLLTQPNNYSRYFHREQRMTGQRRLRLARRYIHEHLSENLRLEDIAKACDSSVRSLTEAFRAQLQISPVQYIRESRLEAVHKELLRAPPTAKITDIATTCGFTHLGRFSAWYKDHFNESPLDTLKK
ncbi:MAG: AraC family transcriptional regulator [Paenalcaligenes sp.]